MTPREFENTASELVRLAMVSKVENEVERIDAKEAFPEWAAEIKDGFGDERVRVIFDADFGDDFVTCTVQNPDGMRSYSRSVDFSPSDDTPIADLYHSDDIHRWKVQF